MEERICGDHKASDRQSMVPAELCVALAASLQRPRAATCSDRYSLWLYPIDQGDDKFVHVEQLELGACFQLQDGRQFILGDRVRNTDASSSVRCWSPFTI